MTIRRLPLLCSLLFTITAAAQSTTSTLQHATGSTAGTPRLIVVISVDQLRYDYVERFAPYFGEGGFDRFLNRGASFPNTRYLHSATFTGPGHATIGTGLSPSRHGIVGNYWFGGTPDQARWDYYNDDNDNFQAPVKPARHSDLPLWYQTLDGSPRYCTWDDTVKVTAGKTNGMSPVELLSDTVGDLIKARFPSSRVIAIAIKDRAAILMSGRNADAAYWFDRRVPGFISSSYYRYDPGVFAFNSSIAGYIPGSRMWNLSPFIPADEMKKVTFDPPEAWPLKKTEYNGVAYGGTFPHPINDIRQLTYSPYGNDLVLDFALSVAITESLGSRDSGPDVLMVSLSSTDYFGHYYGPDSMEVADGMVRLDRSLARFFGALERRLGDAFTVALTADHGVTPSPEILKLRQPDADAGRLDLRNPENGQLISDLPGPRVQIERALAKHFGYRYSADAPYSDAIVTFFEEPALYLNARRIKALRLRPERVRAAVREIVRALPGVASAWTKDEMRRVETREPEMKRLMRASYFDGRSGDVLIALRPNWIWYWGSNSTTHGQPSESDRHVPLLFFGAGIKPGRYANVSAAPSDLARTLGAIIGVEAGGPQSKVLPCVEMPMAQQAIAVPAQNAAAELPAILGAALKQLERDGKLIIVTPPALAPEERSAVKASGHVAVDSVSPTSDSVLPEGYFRLDSIKVDGDHAVVKGWLGPIPRPKPGVMMLACGTGYTFNLERQTDGTWQPTTMAVTMC